MLAKTASAAIHGIDAVPLEVEVDISGGTPSWSLVGMPTAAVREVRERLRAALGNSGFSYPNGCIVVNLAPADLKKDSAALDLPIALGVLAAAGMIRPETLAEYTSLGELGLDGTLRPVRGTLSVALALRESGRKKLLVPAANATEAAFAEGVEVYGIDSLDDAVQFLAGRQEIPPVTIDREALFNASGLLKDDLQDIKGQEQVKRVMEVAAAGGHNVLLIGPPGSGKTMIAKRFSTILPPLTFDESLETTRVHSVAGMLNERVSIVARRPFRSPHHTVSEPGMVGGGSPPTPGEISLAHNGVLFLDELPEFKRGTLEVLRQPLEVGEVTISRAQASLTFPARFNLIAAMNPTPSGFFSDDPRCNNAPQEIDRYINKISGPLLDRIDIHVEVQPITYDQLSGPREGESSATVKARVTAARDRQIERFKYWEGVYCNAHMGARELDACCRLDEAGRRLLERAVHQLSLSARAYDRILKVARSIADLADADDIASAHIAEAVQYRTLDRKIF